MCSKRMPIASDKVIGIGAISLQLDNVGVWINGHRLRQDRDEMIRGKICDQPVHVKWTAYTAGARAKKCRHSGCSMTACKRGGDSLGRPRRANEWLTPGYCLWMLGR